MKASSASDVARLINHHPCRLPLIIFQLCHTALHYPPPSTIHHLYYSPPSITSTRYSFLPLSLPTFLFYLNPFLSPPPLSTHLHRRRRENQLLGRRACYMLCICATSTSISQFRVQSSRRRCGDDATRSCCCCCSSFRSRRGPSFDRQSVVTHSVFCLIPAVQDISFATFRITPSKAAPLAVYI